MRNTFINWGVRRDDTHHPFSALFDRSFACVCFGSLTSSAVVRSFRALSIQEKALGRAHPATATTLCSLGLLLTHANKHQEAEAVLRGALSVREAACGPDHVDVAQCSNALGLALAGLGRHAEVRRSARRTQAEDFKLKRYQRDESKVILDRRLVAMAVA